MMLLLGDGRCGLGAAVGASLLAIGIGESVPATRFQSAIQARRSSAPEPQEAKRAPRRKRALLNGGAAVWEKGSSDKAPPAKHAKAGQLEVQAVSGVAQGHQEVTSDFCCVVLWNGLGCFAMDF